MRAISIASILYLLAGWTLADATSGVVRGHNPQVFLFLAGYAGAAVLWVASIVALVCAVRAFNAWDVMRGAACALVATLAFASPLITKTTIPFFIRHAELRDLQRAGVETLRAEAAALIEASRTKQYRGRWFGREVPREDLPPALAKLSFRATYVTVSNDGIVLVTDGMGGWRGGYMIAPSGAVSVTANSRQITEGVLYVIDDGSPPPPK